MSIRRILCGVYCFCFCFFVECRILVHHTTKLKICSSTTLKMFLHLYTYTYIHFLQTRPQKKTIGAYIYIITNEIYIIYVYIFWNTHISHILNLLEYCSFLCAFNLNHLDGLKKMIRYIICKNIYYKDTLPSANLNHHIYFALHSTTWQKSS